MTKELWMLVIVPISLSLFVLLALIIYAAITTIQETQIERQRKQERKEELNRLVRKFNNEMFRGGDDK